MDSALEVRSQASVRPVRVRSQLPSPRAVAIRYGTWTRRGRQWPANADSLVGHVPADRAALAAAGAFFAVADSNLGRRERPLSRLAVRTALHGYYGRQSADPVARILHAVEAANHAIYTSSVGAWDPRRVSSLVGAAIRPGQAVVAAVGDCRAYLGRGRLLWRITRDHTVAAEALTDARGAAMVGPNPSALTRALGAHPSVRVDVFAVPLRTGDTILLCTDGLTDVVRESRIASVLESLPPREAAQELSEVAGRLGGADNVTAVVVQVGREVVVPPGRSPALPPPAMPARTDHGYGGSVLLPIAEVTGGMLGAAGVIALMLSRIVR